MYMLGVHFAKNHDVVDIVMVKLYATFVYSMWHLFCTHGLVHKTEIQSRSSVIDLASKVSFVEIYLTKATRM